MRGGRSTPSPKPASLPVLRSPGGTIGPAYDALTEMQAKFVDGLVIGMSNTQAARAAGYSAGDPAVVKAIAHKLAHNPKVLAAIREAADLALRSKGLAAINVLGEILEDPCAENKDRLRAAAEILNRSGFGPQSEHTVKVEHVEKTDQEKVASIVRMARQLGLDPRKLLGQAGVDPATITDAEFTEITPSSEGAPR